MSKKSWVQVSLFILILFQIADIQAQKIQKNYTLQWQNPVGHTFTNGFQQTFLTFEDAFYGSDFPDLPAFYQIIPVDKFFAGYGVRATDQQFADLTDEEARLIPADFHQKTISITSCIVFT